MPAIQYGKISRENIDKLLIVYMRFVEAERKGLLNNPDLQRLRGALQNAFASKVWQEKNLLKVGSPLFSELMQHNPRNFIPVDLYTAFVNITEYRTVLEHLEKNKWISLTKDENQMPWEWEIKWIKKSGKASETIAYDFIFHLKDKNYIRKDFKLFNEVAANLARGAFNLKNSLLSTAKQGGTHDDFKNEFIKLSLPISQYGK
ncbi:MAG TPA: hypothetical protein VGM63_00550 [Mucilaginibacter sp.]|jgi:hypothetical protein